MDKKNKHMAIQVLGKMMMCLMLALMLGLTATPANAGSILVNPLSVVDNVTHWTYTYSVDLTAFSQITLGTPAQFTLLDAEGYIPGSATVLPNWVFSSLNSGPIPPNVSPSDDPGIPNLTWTYTGALMTGPLHIGDVAFNSIYGPGGLGEYVGRDRSTSGNNLPQSNYGQIEYSYPTSVPEPGTYALMGAGLLGLAALRRRKGGDNTSN